MLIHQPGHAGGSIMEEEAERVHRCGRNRAGDSGADSAIVPVFL